MILVVWSSPNLDGLTAAAANNIVSGIKNVGMDVESVHLNALNIETCKACGNGWGTCRPDGTCILSDDFAEVYGKLAKADGIVFVSAVYWHDITECMKALFDRMRRCDAFTNKYMKDKECMLVACAGGSGNGAVNCLANMEKTMGHMGIKTVERLPVIRINKDYMLPALIKAGEAFGEKIKNK